MNDDFFIIRYHVTSPLVSDVAKIVHEKVYPRDATGHLTMKDPRNEIISARQAMEIVRQEDLTLVVDNKHYNTPIGRYCIACWKRVPLRERKRLQKEHLNRMINAGGGILV